MIVDLTEWDGPDRIDADLCIIGAGPAGLAIAHALLDSGQDIVLVAGGKLAPDADAQALYAGEQARSSHDYFDLAGCRARQFGGSTTMWSGRCARLAPEDFAPRPWVEGSGWPLGYDELVPFYQRSEAFLRLADLGFADRAREAAGYGTLALDAAKLRPILFQFAGDPGLSFLPLDVGELYRPALAAAGNLSVVLGAHVEHLQAAADAKRIEHVSVRTVVAPEAGGRRLAVHARHVVLATGGLENPRLLLASDDVMSTGLGNQHDQVGRWFQEHARGVAADIVTDKPYEVAELLSVRRELDGHVFLPGLRLAPERIAEQRVLSSGVLVFADTEVDTGTDALKALVEDLSDDYRPSSDFDDNVLRVLTDLDDVAVNLWRRLYLGVAARRPIRAISIEYETEQAPNPSSRVRLHADRDALGMRRLEIDLRYSEIDKRAVQVMLGTMAAEFGRTGLGRLKLREWVEDGDILDPTDFSCHHMGTTRMGADPRTSVVDPDCRVHGVANLHVAGSSVFPTSGYVNPTNTLVALAIRLADRLKHELARG
jgi:choline dehydrogenase-like flavoprotein